jgi:hypothetical protein
MHFPFFLPFFFFYHFWSLCYSPIFFTP